jgi:hypothetical protein
MATTPEEYDANQVASEILRDCDDHAHSKQRSIPIQKVNWTQLRKDKLLLLKRAAKRGITLGTLYAEMDAKFLEQSLLQGLVKKRTKTNKRL